METAAADGTAELPLNRQSHLDGRDTAERQRMEMAGPARTGEQTETLPHGAWLGADRQTLAGTGRRRAEAALSDSGEQA